ncbi:hypothetical protein M0E87_00780 [Corynebacterium sp. CCM 9185]|uniref:Uncharacterized protein n=1 Tax=Corynebacterium marambiense TaxID=2765364 RepID=A0ABS0VY77_9CORY|nr:hypothetical protein [Corynebacterium marambiense]MBI9001741.1 hypothetical protein [Corynebacterium marambiense]MCK7662205.1 hypothetical protein [Corynebacterium marambiense]
MPTIQLQPGDRYDTGQPASAFGELTCEVLTKQKTVLPIELQLRGPDITSPPERGSVEFRFRGDRLRMRNLTGSVRVLLTPGQGGTSFPHDASAQVSYLLHGETAAQNTSLQFPRYNVGGLGSFPLCTLSGESGTVVIEVNQQIVGVELDDLSSRVRGTLCTALGADTLPADLRRDVSLVIDASASMAQTTPPEALSAMYTVACGVLSVVTQGKKIMVASSAGEPQRSLESPAEVAGLAQLELPYNEVGFRMSRPLRDGEAVLVVSDDLPAPLARHNGPVHLLTTRPPVSAGDCSHTLFTPAVCSALVGGDTSVLAEEVHAMALTLVGGKL